MSLRFTLHDSFLGRVTELSNLCGLAQVRAVKKSCHAALVFSHMVIPSHNTTSTTYIVSCCLMGSYGMIMTYYDSFYACHLSSRKVDDSLEASLDVKKATRLERVEVGQNAVIIIIYAETSDPVWIHAYDVGLGPRYRNKRVSILYFLTFLSFLCWIRLSLLKDGPRFFVALLLLPLAKCKSGWGICGSSVVFAPFFLFWLCVDLPLYRFAGTIALQVEFLINLTCLYQFQDRALERHRPNQREKKIDKKKLFLTFLLAIFY